MGRDVRLVDLEDAAARSDALERVGNVTTVLAIDVLEHLPDPRAVMRDVDTALSRPSWLIVVPNAVALPARATFLMGRFPQRDSGLFDRTHLRFFDRRSVQELLCDCFADRGLSIVGLPIEVGGERIGKLPLGGLLARNLRRVLGRLASRWPGLFAYEYLAIVDRGYA
jgi:hypothetical protein